MQSNGYTSAITDLKRYAFYTILEINTTVDNQNCIKDNTQISPASFYRLNN